MSKKNIVRLALILVAVAFVLVGIFRDEAQMVLTKATSICFACIGLG